MLVNFHIITSTINNIIHKMLLKFILSCVIGKTILKQIKKGNKKRAQNENVQKRLMSKELILVYNSQCFVYGRF